MVNKQILSCACLLSAFLTKFFELHKHNHKMVKGVVRHFKRYTIRVDEKIQVNLFLSVKYEDTASSWLVENT